MSAGPIFRPGFHESIRGKFSTERSRAEDWSWTGLDVWEASYVMNVICNHPLVIGMSYVLHVIIILMNIWDSYVIICNHEH